MKAKHRCEIRSHRWWCYQNSASPLLPAVLHTATASASSARHNHHFNQQCPTQPPLQRAVSDTITASAISVRHNHRFSDQCPTQPPLPPVVSDTNHRFSEQCQTQPPLPLAMPDTTKYYEHCLLSKRIHTINIHFKQ